MSFSSRSVAVVICLTASLVLVGGCGTEGGQEYLSRYERDADCSWLGDATPTVVDDLADRVADYAEVDLTTDLSHLTPTQKQVLDLLVEAGKIMDAVFLQQATPCHGELAARIDRLPADEQDVARRYFAINIGPWDRKDHHRPFLGGWEHPEGANYYPLDLTEDERALIESGDDGLSDLFTMVRRDDDGGLLAVPYSEFFAEALTEAARLMNEAAALTENASLKAFLESRAAAFMTDDYFESDMLWMDLDSPVEITIGPYETYEDGLFGFKAAFEAFVTVTDPEESEKLAAYKQELPWLESILPIPEEFKNPNRGSESPIRVVDEVFSGGDTKAGIQTIAFNLPNDERVREAKGSKKVMLRNVMNAKFEKILTPIAEVLVDEGQLPHITAESFFLHTLWHEMSHGLGPGRIVVDGRETEVRLELKDTYSTIEEAKADAMGEWTIFKLQGKGYYPESIFNEQAVTYLAGLFRSVRFGIAEAHGQANAIQFNWLREWNVISVDEETGRFSIDVEHFPAAIEALVRDICILQAEGDYAAARKMIERYAVMPPEMSAGLDRLGGIPVDVKPLFPAFE